MSTNNNRWAKHDAAMDELYERVEQEKAEKEAQVANAEAQRAQYLASKASSSDTTLVPPSKSAPQPQPAVAEANPPTAWDKYINWSAKFYKTNMYDKPKPGHPAQ